MADISSKSCNG